MASHLTWKERDRIAQLCQHGALQKEIARAVGRHRSTISRELRRNRTGNEYFAAGAQQQAERRRRERPLVCKMERPEISQEVRQGLVQEWSPEQIAGRMKQQHPDCPPTTASRRRPRVAPQTIYTWMANQPAEERRHWQSFLRRRGKRPFCRKNTAATAQRTRIVNRPEVVEQRLRLGDFEGDTILGPPGKGGLATLVDRKSRYSIVVKIHSKDSDHVHDKIKLRLKELDAERRRTLTLDNGTEFARCHRLEKHLGMELYFADPGRPYQRGTNENTNGLIRQYFPKGTDFRNVTHYEVRHVEERLNHRPRACLGFKTPHEVFFEKDPPSGCD